MKYINKIKEFFVGLLLLIVSIIILTLLTPWGLIEILIGLFWKRKFVNSLSILGGILMTVAVILDILGNVLMQVPMNRILIYADGYQFGDRHDTISYVLGHNQINEKLTKAGILLCNFLDKLDRDHCARAYFNKHK